jgi:hypothetical protein
MARNLVYLIIVLAVLAGVFLLVRRGGNGETEVQPLFPGFDAGEAGRITIGGHAAETVIEKVNGVWVVTSEDTFPVDPSALDGVLTQTAAFTRHDMVSANPAKQAIYQVDSTGTSITIQSPDGDVLASFVVGKAGPDYQSTYVRRAGSDEVFLASGYLQSVFERGGRTWQDTKIFTLEPDEFTEVYVIRPNQTIGIKTDGAGAWYISEPESAACDQNQASRLVRTIADLRAEDFAGRAPVKESGLAAPDSSIKFTLSGGVTDGLAFGGQTESKRVYAKADNSDIVYLLGAYKVKALMPRLKDLRVEPEAAGPATD